MSDVQTLTPCRESIDRYLNILNGIRHADKHHFEKLLSNDANMKALADALSECLHYRLMTGSNKDFDLFESIFKTSSQQIAKCVSHHATFAQKTFDVEFIACKIFSYCDFGDLSVLSRVNRQFLRDSLKPWAIDTLDTSALRGFCHVSSFGSLPNITRFAQIKSLMIHKWSQQSSEFFKQVSRLNFAKLKRLQWRGVVISELCRNLIVSNLDKLETLELSCESSRRYSSLLSADASKNDSKSVFCLPHLKKLSLEGEFTAVPLECDKLSSLSIKSNHTEILKHLMKHNNFASLSHLQVQGKLLSETDVIDKFVDNVSCLKSLTWKGTDYDSHERSVIKLLKMLSAKKKLKMIEKLELVLKKNALNELIQLDVDLSGLKSFHIDGFWGYTTYTNCANMKSVVRFLSRCAIRRTHRTVVSNLAELEINNFVGFSVSSALQILKNIWNLKKKIDTISHGNMSVRLKRIKLSSPGRDFDQNGQQKFADLLIRMWHSKCCEVEIDTLESRLDLNFGRNILDKIAHTYDGCITPQTANCFLRCVVVSGKHIKFLDCGKAVCTLTAN